MSGARQGSLGAVRTCPHCKATVLASASVCPGCQHHLRFNAAKAQAQPGGRSAIRIEGTIAPERADGNCEYCVVVQISDQHGAKIARHVVGVGALQPGERHSYSFSVELTPTRPDADRKKPDQ